MLRLHFSRGVCCALAVLCIQSVTYGGQIRWRSGAVTTEFKTPVEAAADVVAISTQRGADRRVVLQFADSVSAADKAKLAEGGVTLLNYVGDNAYFAKLDGRGVDAEKLASVASLRATAAIQRDWKLHTSLINNVIHPWMVVDKNAPVGGGQSIEGSPKAEHEDIEHSGVDDPIVAVYAMFHPDVPLNTEAVNTVHRHAAKVVSKLLSNNTLVIELPYSKIVALADEDAIQYIEPPLPKFSELNNSNRVVTQADVVQAAPYNLSGNGVSVMVYDGGTIFTSHPDFGGRATNRDSDSVSDHATHVSGTIGGNGSSSSGLYRGMAPSVLIQNYGFETASGSLDPGFLYTDPGDLEADYTDAINNHSADISNNSIGTNTAPNGFPCAWEGDYGITSNLIDAIVRGSLGSPFRVVWANGNERQGSASCGSTYHTTAPPACAKNHIAVGALNSNDDSVTSFTSWGPADDGRLKPDISGPGCQSDDDFDVTSTSSSGGYTGKCGTSMASPTVCGLGALLLEDFRHQYPGEPDFRNSTLKALLAHTAQDIEETGPDYKTGYGSVRVADAIDQMRSGNFIEDEVSQSDVYSLLVIASSGDPAFSVTLAWDDAPGTPNVDPALVNDLDLRVFDPNGVRQFPWTLNPASPATPATRNQEDHINNIEQVYVANPTTGAWRVEIVGTSVPQGPQPFSLVASPLLVDCSSQGVVSLDRGMYACQDAATILVVDCDLNTDDMAVETVSVQIASSTEAGGETVLLTETAAESAQFEGVILVDTVDTTGVLAVTEGDTIAVTYIDTDDGSGGINVVVTDTATVDCVAPVISNVAAINIEPRDATITFDTDESAGGVVDYGPFCGSLTDSAGGGLDTSHSVALTGLDDNTQYFYTVSATDPAGNSTTDDNGGACYSFATPEVPDFFTEQFEGDFDLDNMSLLLAPSASVDEYTACIVPIATLPTDPTGGTSVTLSDDGSATVNLGGSSAILYGVSYSTIYINANGNITFEGSDSTYTESLTEHFAEPRVAGVFDDLNPTLGGTVSWKQMADRVAVTWDDISEYSTSNSNTFQIELFFDGQIQISWLGVDSSDSVAGISEGNGLSIDFFESDHSGSGSCGPRPPSAGNTSVTAAQDTDTVITLVASDDGLPNPPGALEYIVTALPDEELRDAGTDAIIASVPHTLAGGGNQVIYAPTDGFVGADSLQFKADDTGTPPDGGESLVATVSIQVEPVLSPPFFDDFPTTTFDSNKWSIVTDALIDGVGTGEPSAPNSARFNGTPNGADEIQTHLINLSGQTEVRLTYHWEQTGGGESPDSGDDLFIEFLDNLGQWQLINQHLGSGSDMTTYQSEDIALPSSAFHSTFRLRIRNTATSGPYDDWFVDDVGITAVTPVCPVLGDSDQDGDVDLWDMQMMLLCQGPGGAYASGCECTNVDKDSSGNVDVADWVALEAGVTGPQ